MYRIKWSLTAKPFYRIGPWNLNEDDERDAGPARRREKLVDDRLLGVHPEVLVPDDAVQEDKVDGHKNDGEGDADGF